MNRHLETLRDFIKTTGFSVGAVSYASLMTDIIVRVDDRLDSRNASKWRKDFGAAVLGDEPCRFLQSVITESEERAFRVICKTHDIPEKDMWQVLNFFCVQLRRISDLTSQYEKKPEPSTRMRLATAGMELDVVSMLGPGIFKQSVKEFLGDLANTIRRHGNARHAVPNMYSLMVPQNIRIHYRRDRMHLMADLKTEMEVGHISSNIYLAHLEMDGINLRNLYNQFSSEMKKGRNIPFAALSEEVQSCIKKIDDKFRGDRKMWATREFETRHKDQRVEPISWTSVLDKQPPPQRTR